MNLRPLPGYQHTLQFQVERVPWPVLFPCPFEASRHFEKSAAAEQLLQRDGLHGSFFVDMPREKHTADHADNPPSFNP